MAKKRPQALGYEHVSALRRIANQCEGRNGVILAEDLSDLRETAEQLEGWLDHRRAKKASAVPKGKGPAAKCGACGDPLELCYECDRLWPTVCLCGSCQARMEKHKRVCRGAPKAEDCPWPGCVFARKHKGECRTRDGRLGGN